MRPELVRATDLLRINTPESVEEAIGLLQNTVYSFSMKVCGHPQDAEDNMQEVLFRSLGHLAKIQGPHELAVWLYTVTRNRCWRTRRKSVYAPASIRSLEELLPDEWEIGRLQQDSGSGPEAGLLEAERHQLLHKAILRIPAILRIVLVLHDMEELTTEQVADILQLQPGTVRIRLHRARLSVSKEMNILLKGDSTAIVPRQTSAASSKSAKKRRKQPEDCGELLANLSDYIDGRVEARTCEQVRMHIEACPSCVALVRHLRTAIDRCRSMEMPCESTVTHRLRAILTHEYLRMLVV